MATKKANIVLDLISSEMSSDSHDSDAAPPTYSCDQIDARFRKMLARVDEAVALTERRLESTVDASVVANMDADLDSMADTLTRMEKTMERFEAYLNDKPLRDLEFQDICRRFEHRLDRLERLVDGLDAERPAKRARYD